jgi:hypothetical protein
MDVQDLVNFAKESQGQLAWDTSSLIRISGLLAVKVNAIKNISGQEKQKLICQVLKKVLEEVEKKEVSEETTDEKKKALTEQFASLKKAVDDVIPASLDLALAAARGKLDLKKVKMSVWVKYFSCCARSVVTALASTNVISDAQAKQATDALVAVETKAAAVAAAKDAETAASSEVPASEEDKSKFEQVNPMCKDTKETSETSESSTEGGKAPETQPAA